MVKRKQYEMADIFLPLLMQICLLSPWNSGRIASKSQRVGQQSTRYVSMGRLKLDRPGHCARVATSKMIGMLSLRLMYTWTRCICYVGSPICEKVLKIYPWHLPLSYSPSPSLPLHASSISGFAR